MLQGSISPTHQDCLKSKYTSLEVDGYCFLHSSLHDVLDKLWLHFFLWKVFNFHGSFNDYFKLVISELKKCFPTSWSVISHCDNAFIIMKWTVFRKKYHLILCFWATSESMGEKQTSTYHISVNKKDIWTIQNDIKGEELYFQIFVLILWKKIPYIT